MWVLVSQRLAVWNGTLRARRRCHSFCDDGALTKTVWLCCLPSARFRGCLAHYTSSHRRHSVLFNANNSTQIGTAFGLGSWQLVRREWKRDLIETRKRDLEKPCIDATHVP